MKKSISILLVVVMVISLFAGCGGKKESEGNSSVADDELKGTFTYWIHNGPAFAKETEKTVKEFEELHPGVTINLQKFPYDVLMDKVTTAYAAGTEADLIQGYGSWFQTLIRNDKLEPVPDDMLAAEKDVYYEPALKGYEKDGKYYGMPREVNVEYGLFYNTKDLKEAGVSEIPDNFMDFLEVARKMTKRDESGNITKAGFDYYNWDNSMTLFMAWIIQQGGTYWQEDGIHVNVTSPEAKKAFSLMVDMARGKDAVTDIKRITEQDQIEQLFFKGRSASMTKGPWASALGQEMDVPQEDYAFTYVPPLEGTESLCVSEAGWAEVVSANSKNKDLVWEYLKFAMTKEKMEEFNIATGSLPARKDIAEDPEFQEEGNNKYIKDAFQMLEWAQPMGVFADGDYLRDNLRKQLERAINGKVTVDEALEKLETDVNKHFDEVLK